MLKFSYSLQSKGKLPRINRGVHKIFRLLKVCVLLKNAHNSQREDNKASSQEEIGTMMAHATET